MKILNKMIPRRIQSQMAKLLIVQGNLKSQQFQVNLQNLSAVQRVVEIVLKEPPHKTSIIYWKVKHHKHYLYRVSNPIYRFGKKY